MKKFLIGCGVFVGLIVLIIAVGVGMLIQRGQRMAREIQASQAALAAVNRTYAFTPPSDARLTEARFTAWLGVAEKVADQVSSRFEQLDQPRGRGPDFGAVLSGMTSVFRLYPDVLKVLSDTLGEARMSADEFVWIKNEVEAAVRSEAAQVRPILKELATLLDNAATSFTMMRGGRYPDASGGLATTWTMTNRPIASMPRKVVPITAAQANAVLDMIEKHQDRFKKVAADLYRNPLIGGILDQAQAMAGAGGGRR